jgi:hypothetical protein
MLGDTGQHVGEPSLRIDIVHFCCDDDAVHGGGAPSAAIGAREEPRLSAEGDTAQGAFRRIVKGYGARDAAFPTGIRALVKACNGYRDRGVGSTKRRQAVLSMSCELELLHGRPYDLPGCAASADP